MRTFAAVVAVLLVVGVLGTLITFALYAAIGIGLVAAIVSLARLVRERAGARSRRIQAVARSVVEKVAALDAERALEEATRHPAWAAAVARRREGRQALLEQYIALYWRIRTLPATPERNALNRELWSVGKLVHRTFGVRVSASQLVRLAGSTGAFALLGQSGALLDVEPPHDEVLHLDRDFALTTDCRFGHWAEHVIDAVETVDGLDRVVRRCSFCEPDTFWTERV